MELFFTMLGPLIIAAVALYGMARRVDVYDAVVQGAGEGLGVLIKIVPPLVGLLTAVYMLRAEDTRFTYWKKMRNSEKSFSSPERDGATSPMIQIPKNFFRQ